MKKRRPDHFLLLDILGAIELIQKFTSQMEFQEFDTDQKTQSAVTCQLTIIGEASNQFSDDFRKQHSEIPWRKIIGMRNILVHVYHELDYEGVWNTCQESLPELEHQLRSISNVE